MSSIRIKAEKCSVCDKVVYAQEKMEADGKLFHKGCMKCKECHKPLGLGNFAAMGGEYFCKPHFKQLFKLKGNYDEGFGKTKHSMRWVGGQRPDLSGSGSPSSPTSDPRRVNHSASIGGESSPSSSPSQALIAARAHKEEEAHKPVEQPHQEKPAATTPVKTPSAAPTPVADPTPAPAPAAAPKAAPAKSGPSEEERLAEEKRVAERRAKLLEDRKSKMEAQKEEERKKVEELKQTDPEKAAVLEKQQTNRYRRASIAKLANGGALVSIKDRYKESAGSGNSSPVPAKLLQQT